MPYVCDVPSFHTAALPQYIQTCTLKRKKYETFNLDLQYRIVYIYIFEVVNLKECVASLIRFLPEKVYKLSSTWVFSLRLRSHVLWRGASLRQPFAAAAMTN